MGATERRQDVQPKEAFVELDGLGSQPFAPGGESCREPLPRVVLEGHTALVGRDPTTLLLRSERLGERCLGLGFRLERADAEPPQRRGIGDAHAPTPAGKAIYTANLTSPPARHL